jgi:hypothetical protein
MFLQGFNLVDPYYKHHRVRSIDHICIKRDPIIGFLWNVSVNFCSSLLLIELAASAPHLGIDLSESRSSHSDRAAHAQWSSVRCSTILTGKCQLQLAVSGGVRDECETVVGTCSIKPTDHTWGGRCDTTTRTI